MIKYLLGLLLHCRPFICDQPPLCYEQLVSCVIQFNFKVVTFDPTATFSQLYEMFIIQNMKNKEQILLLLYVQIS